MKLILYSNPSNGILEKIEKNIFSNNKTVFGYMPADGADPKPEFESFWRDLAKKHNAEFVYIDNSVAPTKEQISKIETINSLTITGGNVFSLLYQLRLNEYDKIIEKLIDKNDFVYSGFSAGAMIVTPDIRLAGKEYGWNFGYDKNIVKLSDTKALGFVDFEIVPHYEEKFDKQKLIEVQNNSIYKIKPISDRDFIVVEKNGLDRVANPT